MKYIGLSEVSVDQVRKAQGYIKVVSVQNMYCVENRKWESVLDYCNENDLAFIPWYPLNAGNIHAVERLNTIAAKYNATAHQVALSWLLHHSNNILLIPGTSQKHLEENVLAANISLTEEDKETLEALRMVDISG